MMENHEANAATNSGPRTALASRSAVAICCLNSAVMLRAAYQGEIDTKEKRAAATAANNGQAGLLIAAADIADEMLAALQWIAAIAKATGAA